MRLLPGVARLHPTRTGLDALAHGVGELLDAVADDPTVAIRPMDGRHRVELRVGLEAGASAPDAGRAVAEAVRAACAGTAVTVERVRVRISSVE